jgi:hypothetical protein
VTLYWFGVLIVLAIVVGWFSLFGWLAVAVRRHGWRAAREPLVIAGVTVALAGLSVLAGWLIGKG